MDIIKKRAARIALGGISNDKIDELIKTGELPYVLIGSRKMFKAEDIQTFIEDRRVASRPHCKAELLTPNICTSCGVLESDKAS